MSDREVRRSGGALAPGQEIVVEVVDDDLVEVVRDCPEPPEDGDRRSRTTRPHPLFWLSLGLLVPASLAAGAADGVAPSVALRSEWVWRLEIGIVVFLLGYVLGILLWLAYFGRTVPHVELPSGTGLDLPEGGDLTRAAEQTGSIAARYVRTSAVRTRSTACSFAA